MKIFTFLNQRLDSNQLKHIFSRMTLKLSFVSCLLKNSNGFYSNMQTNSSVKSKGIRQNNCHVKARHFNKANYFVNWINPRITSDTFLPGNFFMILLRLVWWRINNLASNYFLLFSLVWCCSSNSLSLLRITLLLNCAWPPFSKIGYWFGW